MSHPSYAAPCGRGSPWCGYDIRRCCTTRTSRRARPRCVSPCAPSWSSFFSGGVPRASSSPSSVPRRRVRWGWCLPVRSPSGARASCTSSVTGERPRAHDAASWARPFCGRGCITIFLGVENPGRGFFPESLTYLESYFGPQRNSVLLPISIALLIMFTLRTIIHALRDASPVRRQGMMLLSVLGVLGVLELSVLGMPVTLPFWQAFLDVRGY